MKKHLKISYKNSESSSVYTADGTAKRFVLVASSLDSNWSNPGEVFLCLEDDGDKLKLDISGVTLSLNYFQAELIRIALKLNDNSPRLTEIIERPVRGLHE